jgi:hypothetical protein
MTKYNIEGGIDFFNELYKSLDLNDNDDDENNMCLITNETLKDRYITLNCNHKFNYVPLFYDIYNHKLKFNSLEGTNSRLSTNEIRCPYCRKKQEGVLPYYEDLVSKKVNGVNFYDPNFKHHSNSNSNYTVSHKCQYKWTNDNYNPDEPESLTNSKYIKKSCHNYFGTQILIYNKLNPSQPITYGDNNYYCYIHKREMIKNYKLQQKEKEKKEKKEAKLLEKQMKLTEKQNAKIKEKEEKQKAKALKKNLMSENVVLGPSNLENKTGCIQILKTGLNKGSPCGCKIVNENMCKRHYLLAHKQLNINN